jgi:hypothetical protein
MRYPVRFTFLLLVLAVLLSGYADRERAYILEESELTLIGTSNIKPFSCVCEEDFEPITYELEQHCDGHYIFKGTRLRIPVRALDCGNRIMNKDLFEALKADAYPEIVIQPKELHLPLTLNVSEGWSDLTAEASVGLAGRTRQISLPVRVKALGKATFRIQSRKTLCMRDFGITPPTAMGGLIKVEEEIDIHFDLVVATQ